MNLLLPFSALLSAIALLWTPSPSTAQEAPTDDAGAALVFGMSAAFTGPAADLGLNLREGIEAAFAEANAVGGVRGRELVLESRDDGYEPERTVPNMEAFVAREDMLGVIGNVGTPTALVALPIAIEADMLFYGAYTGAGALRQTPPDRVAVNYRASYAEETGAMVDALVEHAGLAPEDIAFFTQRDGYGDAGFSGGLAALKRHGLKSASTVLHTRYQRNTVAVEGALADMLMALREPKAVIMVGAYAPCARFIELAREMEFEPLFLNVSFVGTASLGKALGEHGEGVIVTQVVPHPEAELPIIAEYRAAMSARFELTNTDPEATFEATFGSLEGYVSARVLIRALEEFEGVLDRQTVVDALEQLGTFDLGLGVPLEVSPKDHQASHTVWPTVFREGRAEPFDWTALGAE